jgi:hypothetical protein
MRGCISFGDAIMDRDRGIFFGEPIIEAARGEQAQQWIGMAFGPSLNTPAFSRLGDVRMVMPFEGHVKSDKGSYIENIALDWPCRWRAKFDSDPIDQINKLDSDPNHSPYDNVTRRFAMFSAENEERWNDYDFETRQFQSGAGKSG